MKGGLLWQGKALSGNKKNLAGELCVVAREFSGLSLNVYKFGGRQASVFP